MMSPRSVRAPIAPQCRRDRADGRDGQTCDQLRPGRAAEWSSSDICAAALSERGLANSMLSITIMTDRWEAGLRS